MDEREELQERYDDAAFALMMDECAESDGAAFLAEFRAAAAAGALPQVPEDMDRLFRDTIRREYAGRERRVRFRQFKRAAARVAVAMFAAIGILGTLVMSVEALRVPVQNFFINFFEEYVAISTDEEKTSGEDIVNSEDIGACLGNLLPEDYTQEVFPQISAMESFQYINGAGDIVSLDIISDGAYMNIDTENAAVNKIDISDYKALLIEKNGLSVIWTDDAKTTYVLYASNIPKEQVIEICWTLVELCK